MTSYRVVFDSTQTQAQWLLSDSVILLFAVGFLALLLWMNWRARKSSRGTRVIWGVVFVVVSVGFYARYASHYWWQGILYYHRGAYKTVEGPVRNYLAKQMTDGNFEQFMVGDITFGYLDIGRGKCFHKTAQNGGPIREGLQVRVGYTDSVCIVKLEVAQ
jgi:hypothetical protein